MTEVKRVLTVIVEWCKIWIPVALVLSCNAFLSNPGINCPVMPHQPAVYASISKPISDSETTWGDVVRYKFQQVMSMQMFGKLTAVIITAAPIVVLGGFGYKLVTGDRMRDSMFKAYSIMGDVPGGRPSPVLQMTPCMFAGADAVEMNNPAALFICNLIFVAGLLTVAVTLGIICDDISNFVSEVRHGNYQMVEEGHTVILNVNRLLGPVLKQIAEASRERGSFRGPIVVLADVDKEELEELVSREAEGLNLRISTRRGCTHDAMDLKRVAAGKADCVIWLEPDSNDELSVAAIRACSIATLKALGAGEKKRARIVVQTSHDSVKSAEQLTNVPMAFRTPPLFKDSKLNVLEQYEEENFNGLLAQSALQPGLSAVLEDVLQHNDGKEFYISRGADLGGEKYSTVRRQLESVSVCGIYTPSTENAVHSGKVRLNPPEDTVLLNNDQLIVLSESAKNAFTKREQPPAASEWVNSVERRSIPCWSRNIIVLCFGNEDRLDSGFLASVDTFAPKGVSIVAVANSWPEEAKVKGTNCKISYMDGNPASFSTLKKLSKRKVDCIVLAGLEDLPPKIADAQLISSLIQIQEVANVHWEDKTGFSVVSPLNFIETKKVGDHLIEEGRTLPVPISLDVLLPSEMASGILVQVAGTPILDAIFKDLLRDQGCEIYLRDPAEFSLIGRGPVKAHEVADLVRRFDETFLGVLKEDKTFQIAPNSLSEHEYKKGERLIVLATEFVPELEG